MGYAVQCANVAHHLWTQYKLSYLYSTCVLLHTFETVLHDLLSEEQVTVYILILLSKTDLTILTQVQLIYNLLPIDCR